ncbi:Hpt domain-containing protein [Parasphingorhabdus sp. JC815]|uniref:Hpt domain-containing protein n=1 Tax=Parasphingorhabdus sp. JC815 TaxID=3232140 RepID=UPI00345B37B1
MQPDIALIDRAIYGATRSTLGPDFVRILGYFREDGAQSVENIETAMRASDAAAMIMPAHRLKGESLQFGAMRLAAVTERIEMTARKCVEQQQAPDEILEQVGGLRSLFEETLPILEYDSSPVVRRESMEQSMPVKRRTTLLGGILGG